MNIVRFYQNALHKNRCTQKKGVLNLFFSVGETLGKIVIIQIKYRAFPFISGSLIQHYFYEIVR